MPKLNDINILARLKQLCYDSNDVRACWIADYDLNTDINEYKNYARWSLQHYTMYKGFFDEIDNVGNIDILDAACGNGFNTKMLSKEFPNAKCVGVDLNKNCIDFAKEFNNNNNVTYLNCNLFDLDHNIKYDYIFF